MADSSPRRRCVSHSPFNRPDFGGDGTGVISGRLAKSIWDEHKKPRRKPIYLAKYELRNQLAETWILSKLNYADLLCYPYQNSCYAVWNEFNLLLQVLYSVTMLRTFGIYLKSDGFQLTREEISTS